VTDADRPAIRTTTSCDVELSVVVVNYESWPDTHRLASCLTRSPAFEAGRAELIVVDNGSVDPPPEDPLWAAPGVRLLQRPDNGGFATGVNTAWRESRGRWLLLLNPDTAPEADFPERVLERLAAIEARGADAPAVIGFALGNADGSPQLSVGPFPSLTRCLFEVLLPRRRRKYWRARRHRPGPVPWVTGACALVRSAFLDAIGGMDDAFFLYHEEVALCRTAWLRGWSVAFDPSIGVPHLRPLQDRPVSPRLRVITRHSKLLYFLKFRPAWEFRALRWIVAGEAALKARWCRGLGRLETAAAWRSIGRLAAEIGPDRGPRGREILDWVEDRASADPPGSGDPRHPSEGRDNRPAWGRSETGSARGGREPDARSDVCPSTSERSAI